MSGAGHDFSVVGLLAQAECLHDGTVAVDILLVEIFQHFAATTYQLGQRTGSAEVLVVLLQVLREVLDAIGEQGNLALSGTGIGGRLSVLLKNLFLLLLV